jgi:MFS family permease
MQGQKPGIREAFSSLQSRDYQHFAVALLVFNLVTQIHQIVTAWQIYDMTGSPLQVGLTGLARAIPHMTLSLVGGVVADRVDRARLMMVSQAAIGVLLLLLALLTASGQIAVWHVYALTLAISAVQAIATPARTAIIPRLVPRERLVNAIALNATISQTAQIVGPSIGGVGIAAVGVAWTYLGTGLITVVSLVSLATIRPIPSEPQIHASPWRSMVEGLAFVRQNSVIIAFMLMDTAATCFGSYRALMPFIAASLGMGPEGFGYLSAAPGVGSVIGAVIMMSLGDMRYKGLFTVFGILLYSASLIVLALAPWFALALFAAALLGFFNVVQVVPRNSAIMALTPDRLRGRVEAFRTMLAGGSPSLGQATSGAIASVIGTPLALIVGAFASALTVVAIGIAHKDLRDPDLGSTRLPTRPDIVSHEPAVEAGRSG